MPDSPAQTDNSDGKGDSHQKTSWGSMGLGKGAVLGNMTAMMVLIVFFIRGEIRAEKKDERIFEVIADNGARYERLAGSFETHIATQIGETRENRIANDRLANAVDKNTQSNERLIWTITNGAGWPLGPVPKKD